MEWIQLVQDRASAWEVSLF